MTEAEKILGIDGGGTRTAWVLLCRGEVVERGKLPPANLRLTRTDELRRIFKVLPDDADRVGIFVAGCATDADRLMLARVAQEVWPKAQIVAGSDRDSGMAACLGHRDGIVVNAGTGSSVTGRRGTQIEQAGGWGHILGDIGGAYFISIRALRVILRDYDLRQENRGFAASVLRALSLGNFDELVHWAQGAEKTQVASLAPIVFTAAAEGDEAVQRIIDASASALADFAAAVARRVELPAADVKLMGGLFRHQPSYVSAFQMTLAERLPDACVAIAETAPELGAAWLAVEGKMHIPSLRLAESPQKIALTEHANAGSEQLDKLSSRQLAELFVSEERCVERALRAKLEQLADAIDLAAGAVANGGSIFYVGAGSSGRVGIMDAAEIPPTFGVGPNIVQGIIAGGAEALARSIEGAEDDERNGALAMDERNVTGRDLVVGISASGSAPFVLGALRRARAKNARTILLTCNAEQEASIQVDLTVDLPTGAEILAGSTRLKAATATKVALNIISTGAMVRLGRVRGNLMIDLQPTNQKLRGRAVRLVAQLSNCDEKTARARLDQTGWNVRVALQNRERAADPPKIP